MKKFLLILLVSFVAFFGDVNDGARADIMITPIQVVFEGRERFANVTIVNTGNKTNSYELAWVSLRMKDGGGGRYEKAKAPSSTFDLPKHIVFAPKRVTLGAGSKQKIRLALRRPANIPDGDYHAHLKFMPVPSDNSQSEGDNIDKGNPSVGVKVIVSYSIPVILRSGEVNVISEMGDMVLSRNENTGLLVADIPIHRSGSNYSILGSLFVYHIDSNGKENLVGELGNAYILPEASNRIFRVNLTKNISGGSLRVVLRSYDKNNPFTYVERLFSIE